MVCYFLIIPIRKSFFLRFFFLNVVFLEFRCFNQFSQLINSFLVEFQFRLQLTQNFRRSFSFSLPDLNISILPVTFFISLIIYLYITYYILHLLFTFYILHFLSLLLYLLLLVYSIFHVFIPFSFQPVLTPFFSLSFLYFLQVICKRKREERKNYKLE